MALTERWRRGAVTLAPDRSAWTALTDRRRRGAVTLGPSETEPPGAAALAPRGELTLPRLCRFRKSRDGRRDGRKDGIREDFRLRDSEQDSSPALMTASSEHQVLGATFPCGTRTHVHKRICHPLRGRTKNPVRESVYQPRTLIVLLPCIFGTCIQGGGVSGEAGGAGDGLLESLVQI